MELAYTVALVGFSQHESGTFESFLRLAARRPPAYRVQEEVLDAQVLLVNADNAQAMALVRGAGLPGRVLLVGSHDAGTGWPLQRKPVRLVSLLVALDTLVGRRPPPAGAAAAGAPVVPTQADPEPFKASQLHGLQASMQLASGRPVPPLSPAPGPRRRSADTEFPPTRPMSREPALAAKARVAPVAPVAPTVSKVTKAPAAAPARVVAPAPAQRLPFFDGDIEDLLNVAPPAPRARATRSPRSRIATGEAELPEAPRGDALLVAQSLVEGRILTKRFRKYELTLDWCREPAQAQAMLKAHAYRLVIIDRLGGQPDAFTICRWAKAAKGPKGAPSVLMFAPTAGSMDRMKAGLAGADAYLSRSVNEAELYKVLAQHRLVNLNGFAPTNVGVF